MKNQIQIFSNSSLSALQEIANEWMSKQDDCSIYEMRFEVGEYGRYILLIWYFAECGEKCEGE